MNSPTYPPEGTQKRIILDELLRANGIPLGVNTLMRKARSAAVHSCISTLRTKHGWNIRNKQRRGKDAQGRSITINPLITPMNDMFTRSVKKQIPSSDRT